MCNDDREEILSDIVRIQTVKADLTNMSAQVDEKVVMSPSPQTLMATPRSGRSGSSTPSKKKKVSSAKVRRRRQVFLRELRKMRDQVCSCNET